MMQISHRSLSSRHLLAEQSDPLRQPQPHALRSRVERRRRTRGSSHLTRVKTTRRYQKEIDTIEKLAELFVEAMDDLRSDMSARFDVLERHLQLPEAA